MCQIAREESESQGSIGTERKAVIVQQEHVFLQIAGDSPEQDEDHLLKASQQGDQDAFAILVRQYQQHVFNLSLRLVHNYDEASDITQEAFLAAWQGLPSFRGEARFSTWLSRITYHCGLCQLEKRNREGALHEAMQVKQSASMRGQESDLEDMVEKHEQQALLRVSLAQLPTRYRLILILRDFQEMRLTQFGGCWQSHQAERCATGRPVHHHQALDSGCWGRTHQASV